MNSKGASRATHPTQLESLAELSDAVGASNTPEGGPRSMQQEGPTEPLIRRCWHDASNRHLFPQLTLQGTPTSARSPKEHPAFLTRLPGRFGRWCEEAIHLCEDCEGRRCSAGQLATPRHQRPATGETNLGDCEERPSNTRERPERTGRGTPASTYRDAKIKTRSPPI